MAKWILNSTPIIVLARMKHAKLFQQLSEEMIIPLEVLHEILAGPNDDPAKLWVEDEGSIFVKPSIPISPLVSAWDLGKGESAVLNWGYQNPGWEIVVDDKAARKCAKALNLPFLGSIGIIVRAKKSGFIERAAPLLQALSPNGFHINPEIIHEALQLAGEAD